MTDNIVQTLISTRTEHPIDDVDEWVDRLTSLEDEARHTRRDGSEPRLLTEKEAEVIVRSYGTQQSRQEIADALGVSKSRVDNLRHAAEDDLLAADATLGIINEMRRDIRPDPYS